MNETYGTIQKSKCLIKVKETANELEIEGLINNVNSLLNNDAFQIINLKKDIASTQSASNLIIALFNIVAVIGIFFSFFVLWLSFSKHMITHTNCTVHF